MKYLQFLFILISYTSFQCCIKPANKCPRYFEIPVEYSPLVEEYKIGDTLTLKSIFHKEVYERQTDKRYNLEGINWDFTLNIAQVDIDSTDRVEENAKTSEYIDFLAEDQEKYNLRYYNYSDGGSSLEGEYIHEKDSFKIELGLVLKKTGIFLVAGGPPIYQSKQDFPGKCKLTSFDVDVDANEGKNNNVHLLKESLHPHYNDWILKKPEERFRGSYSYRVVE